MAWCFAAGIFLKGLLVIEEKHAFLGFSCPPLLLIVLPADLDLKFVLSLL